MNIRESDGSPDTFPWQLNVSNGTLTDNADGTVTVATGGGGDAITVNATAATDANFLDNIYIDWSLDTAATPDDITAKLDYTQTLAGNPAFAAGEVALTTSGTTGGVLFEGAADTIEGLLQWAPTTADRTVTIQDSTHTLVGRDTTDTLTNKTIDATNTVTIDVTDITAAASATWAGQVTDETGTGVWVFGTSPTITTSLSQDGDSADAGYLRLNNTAIIGWEASPAGTDVTLAVDASEEALLDGSVGLGLDDQADLRFYETDVNGTNFLAFEAPAAITTTSTCTLENDANPIPDSCVGDGTDAGGTPSWSGLTAPTAATSFVSDATAETYEIDFQSAFASGAQLFIEQTTGNPTGGSLASFTVNDADVAILRVTNAGAVTVADGLVVEATNVSGVLTDGIDASDGELVNALNFGGNVILAADGGLVDLDAINSSSTTEGLHLPQGTAPTGNTSEGAIAWDTDDDTLYIGDGTTAIPLLTGIFWEADITSQAATFYLGCSVLGDSGTETTVDCRVGRAVKVRGLAAYVATAPGAGNSWAVTIRDDAADTLTTCTISGTATSCTNDTVSSIAADSLVDVAFVETGTAVGTGEKQVWFYAYAD